MASSFEKISNHILESAEHVATRLEEGLSVVMTGKLPGEEGAESTTTTQDYGDGVEEDIMMEMDEDMMGSPLEGIADGVLSDIMSSQVGRWKD